MFYLTQLWQRGIPAGVLALLLVIGGSSVFSGCGGCRSTASPDAEGQKKDGEKEDERPPFEKGDLQTLPSEGGPLGNFVKPGHAVTASVPLRANDFDFRADLETMTTDFTGRPLRIADTNYHLVMTRPVVLPKGQVKYLESTCFVTPDASQENRTVYLQYRAKGAKGGQTVAEGNPVMNTLSPYQYLFVVLASNPNAYGYLKQVNSVRLPYDELADVGTGLLYYQVVLPEIDSRIPLPSHPFAWTPFAYLLWDDVLPGLMTPDQQRAMIDWLHWGGQLIVSGPNALHQLSGSFLEDYLPARAGSTVALGPDEFGPLNEYWSQESSRAGARLTLNVQPTSPLVGIELQKAPDAEFVAGTGNLVVERRIGRGRIVVTAFGLTGPDVVNWPSFDSFLNNCLLRRPPRFFSANQFGSVLTDWAGFANRREDPRFVTATRYFTRDVGHETRWPEDSERDAQEVGWEGSRIGGPGAWNDLSGASRAAHDALRRAAGISIPEASFVLKVLVVYLLVLVPINWGIFRMLGRVEWAWVAAPVIAVIGAIAVIRLAQLDIGFVRSRTELAVLEAQGGYSRAHVTRYLALYASLSSAYELQFDDPLAVALPFPPTSYPDQLWPITCRRDRDLRASGFQVDSNTTGFVHAEQMYEMGGDIRWAGDGTGQPQVQNNSSLELTRVRLLQRTVAGEIRVCRIDRLPAKSAAPVQWSAAPESQPSSGGDASAGDEDPERDGEDVRLDRLLELAAQGVRLRPGDIRLVALTDGEIAGMTVHPNASQLHVQNVVLVHLRYGPLPPPRPDMNLARDVQQVNPNAESDDLPADLNVLPDAAERSDPR